MQRQPKHPMERHHGKPPARSDSSGILPLSVESVPVSVHRHTGHRRGKPSLGISIPPQPSFSSYKYPTTTSSPASSTQSPPIRRKPLPPTATANPRSKQRSASQLALPVNLSRRPLPSKSRASSVDSPPISPKNRSLSVSTPGRTPSDFEFVIRDLNQYPHGNTPRVSATLTAATSIYTNSPTASPNQSTAPRNIIFKPNHQTAPRHVPPKLATITAKSPTSQFQPTENNEPSSPKHQKTTTMSSPGERKPSLQLHLDVTREDGSAVYFEQGHPPPKSPGQMLGSFFGWKPRDSDSPATTFSSPAISPALPHYPFPSQSPSPGNVLRHAKTMPTALDIPRANAALFAAHHVLGASVLPTPPASSAQVSDLEQELQEISTELANSIRREMELEDEVERWRSQCEQSTDARRTSDYFSDSGASSVRHGESDAKIDELEKSRRKIEQEKAQLKLDMSDKMAQVLKQRRLVEDRMHLLEEHVQTHSRSVSISPSTDSDRLRQLERLLEESKRKLAEERLSRANMEELIGGMRHEIQQYQLERNNFRDEVVPQLQSKVASLEMFVSDGKYFHHSDHNVDSIAEDVVSDMLPAQKGVVRSRSVVNRRAPGARSRPTSTTGQGGLSRSGSVKDLSYESRDQLAERVRDMEAQREGLHKALKTLLQRQKWQEKEHVKRIKQLEVDKYRAMTLTPRRTAFHREVKNMREEILLLRTRADDALDQKWHCEKGLSGLKMDLDRSHQETGSLRKLLYDATMVPQDGVQGRRPPQRQDSLDKAYNELQTTHALSLAHVNGLASPSSLGRNNDSAHILSLLNKSISDAQAERNAAQEQAELYRKQARELQRAELDHIGKEQSLAKELYASATRMDQLAAQVKVQLDANSDLRQRLAGAIDRGEQEQASSAERIAELQGKLRVLEDSLVAAQQTSEDAITGHEEQVRLLQESSKQSTALQRQNAWSTGLVADGPASPLPPHLFALKSPRLDKTSSGTGMSMGEQTRTPQLEQRVRELETALAEAEGEMGKVVSRMNRAQIEVAELQGERDEASMRSRRLQAEIVVEREKVKGLMAQAGWKAITNPSGF